MFGDTLNEGGRTKKCVTNRFSMVENFRNKRKNNDFRISSTVGLFSFISFRWVNDSLISIYVMVLERVLKMKLQGKISFNF